MAQGLHIAISAETLFSFNGIEIANTQFTSFALTAILVAFFIYASTKIKHNKKPTGVQNFVEMVIESLFGIVENVAEKGKKAEAFAPLVIGFLIFIAANNWIALLPGFHTIKFTGDSTIKLTNVPSWMKASPVYASVITEDDTGVLHVEEEVAADAEHAAEGEVGTVEEHAEELEEHAAGVDILRGANADLNMTLALALISVGATQYFGVKFAGLAYFKKFFNFSSPINFFIGILELVSEFSKIISFAFRLFGNILAGEVLVSVMKFLVPLLIPIPFIGFEVFVGGLQAYIFGMLSLVFFNMAASDHH